MKGYFMLKAGAEFKRQREVKSKTIKIVFSAPLNCQRGKSSEHLYRFHSQRTFDASTSMFERASWHDFSWINGALYRLAREEGKNSHLCACVSLDWLLLLRKAFLIHILWAPVKRFQQKAWAVDAVGNVSEWRTFFAVNKSLSLFCQSAFKASTNVNRSTLQRSWQLKLSLNFMNVLPRLWCWWVCGIAVMKSDAETIFVTITFFPLSHSKAKCASNWFRKHDEKKLLAGKCF